MRHSDKRAGEFEPKLLGVEPIPKNVETARSIRREKSRLDLRISAHSILNVIALMVHDQMKDNLTHTQFTLLFLAGLVVTSRIYLVEFRRYAKLNERLKIYEDFSPLKKSDKDIR